MRKNARAFRECHSTFEASRFRQPEGRGFFLQPKHVHSASLVSARTLARSGRTLLHSGKHLARPTSCLQIDDSDCAMGAVTPTPTLAQGVHFEGRGSSHRILRAGRARCARPPALRKDAHAWPRSVRLVLSSSSAARCASFRVSIEENAMW
jgi:hypothetical protein